MNADFLSWDDFILSDSDSSIESRASSLVNGVIL